MSICQDQPSISTDTQLAATFGNGTTIIGILPSVPNPASDRDDKGKLTEATLTTIMSSLGARIPSPVNKTTTLFIEQQSTFLVNLKSEYCFYESRYKYALNQLFNAIASDYGTTVSQEKQVIINSRLETTKKFNLRLNDLIQIINKITVQMLSTPSTIQADIVAYNETLEKQKISLDKQNKIINSGQGANNIRKEMVKYTEEKAKYTDNLLKLYSFLNIVTLGLLVYIYKAAGNE